MCEQMTSTGKKLWFTINTCDLTVEQSNITYEKKKKNYTFFELRVMFKYKSQ